VCHTYCVVLGKTASGAAHMLPAERTVQLPPRQAYVRVNRHGDFLERDFYRISAG